MLKNKDSVKIKPLFDLAFSKRPEHELYNLREDPFQMNNLAEVNEYKPVLKELSDQLKAYLIMTKDPREVGQLFDWDNATYYKDRDKKPKPSKKNKIRTIKKRNLLIWCPHTDSNREPTDYKSVALPIEL